MDIYEKMKELGVELPAAPAKGGLYSSCKKFGGNLFYVSGCGPVIDAWLACLIKRLAKRKMSAPLSLRAGM